MDLLTRLAALMLPPVYGPRVRIESGQVAVVTGAASGIGAALARGFAARGVNVVLSDIRIDRLRDTCAEITDAEVLAVTTDVRDPEQVEALAAATVERFGRVDIVCNNAGVASAPGPIWEQPVDAWRWVLDVALHGVINGMRTFVPLLLAQDSGYVLNTASVGGLCPLPMLGPYNAAKHAVVGLSETLKAEFQSVGAAVEVGVLCPGWVETELVASSAANTPTGLSPAAGRSPVPDGMTPDELARLTFRGMESGRLHLITHPDSFMRVRDRLASVEVDLVDP
jgi:NAD(P)-dependent dehydrogenase (short-subunit alcohol dehydrogenase family)